MCQEFCPGEGEMGVYTPEADSPWADTPLGRHPPWADSPPPWADTPTEMVTAADGTHPIGMHSCCQSFLSFYFLCQTLGKMPFNLLINYYILKAQICYILKRYEMFVSFLACIVKFKLILYLCTRVFHSWHKVGRNGSIGIKGFNNSNKHVTSSRAQPDARDYYWFKSPMPNQLS